MFCVMCVRCEMHNFPRSMFRVKGKLPFSHLTISITTYETLQFRFLQSPSNWRGVCDNGERLAIVDNYFDVKYTKFNGKVLSSLES